MNAVSTPRPPSRPSPAAAEPATGARSTALLVLGLLALTLAFWLIGVQGDVLRPTSYAHPTWLADAFLHGQLHLRHVPEVPADLAPNGKQMYVVFGPLTAVIMMPVVAAMGLSAPDVLVLVLTALAGVWACFQLLRAKLGDGDPVLLACGTLTFALGTAMHYGAPMGAVWLHTQITATTLQAFALWAAARGRGRLAGVLLALGVLTRPTVALAAPFAWWLLADATPARARGARAAAPQSSQQLLALALPIVAASVLLGIYNAARFGSPFDAGYLRQLISEPLAYRIREHGQFSAAFLPENLYGLWLRPPVMGAHGLEPDPRGMSLLLTTPFLLLAFVPRAWTPLERNALLCSALIALPALLYYNDGSMQFGNRFALDWIVLGLLAATSAARRAPRVLVIGLTVWGVAVGAWGLHWFRAAFLR